MFGGFTRARTQTDMPQLFLNLWSSSAHSRRVLAFTVENDHHLLHHVTDTQYCAQGNINKLGIKRTMYFVFNLFTLSLAAVWYIWLPTSTPLVRGLLALGAEIIHELARGWPLLEEQLLLERLRNLAMVMNETWKWKVIKSCKMIFYLYVFKTFVHKPSEEGWVTTRYLNF